ncbi:winged helix-turn-helix domain-containing protein [Maribacter sp. 4G9]|uniref:winged helix-turn-helix domain-containing protein n=1 Tax=Maribacter sp. 4G9 TaxID=1889777 RepID=UPI003977BB7C
MVFPSAAPVDEAAQEKPKDRLVDELVNRLVNGLVESQQKIVRLINDNPKISKREMSETIGISTTAIDNNINSLKEKNILERVGGTRGHWQINSEPNG